MKIKLTEDMIFAIGVSFDELSNCYDWQDYLEDDQIDKVFKGRDQILNIINQLNKK